MSRSAPLCFSEGMDGITCGRRAQMRLERRAVDHINWPLEVTGDPLIDDLRVGHRSSRPRAHMPPPVCRGHCSAGFATRNRAEYGDVRHAVRAQSALMATQSGKGILNVQV